MQRRRVRAPWPRCVRALLPCVLALGGGCGDPTQLVLVIHSDMGVGEMDRVRITIEGPSSTITPPEIVLTDPGAPTLPLTLGISPSGGANTQITVTVVGSLGSTPVVERRARTNFVDGDTRALVLVLRRACRGQCLDSPTTTCGEMGSCESIDVPRERLVVWTGRAPPFDDRPRPLGTCQSPTLVEGTIGTVSVTFDTTGGPRGVLPLGMGCGAGNEPPQAIVRYRVPGTGLMGVTFTTANPGTESAFDTIVEVRRGGCAVPPADPFGACFDDAVPGSVFQSSGGLAIEGGSDLDLLLTGYQGSMMDSGRVQLDITAGPASAPVLEAGTVGLAMDGALFATATGRDADANATGVVVTLRDRMGMAIDTTGDGVVNELDELVAPFESPVIGTMLRRARATDLIGADAADQPELLQDAGAVQAELRVLDATFLRSAALVVPIGLRPIAPGQMCVAVPLAECAGELMCTGGLCAVSPAVMSACAEARALTLTGGVGGASGSLAAGGLFEGSCGDGASREDLHRVTVPSDGRYDLLVTTDLPGTPAGVNTVLHVRQQCELPTTEIACDDDGAPSQHSTIEVFEVMAGDHIVIVEASPPSSMYQLEVRLRRLRETGEACDVMGRNDRCRFGVCGASAVCP